MRPLIVTNLAGERRRLNPLAVEGWATAEHTVDRRPEVGGGTAILRGSKIALASGRVVDVRESERELDLMFAIATADPEQVRALALFMGDARIEEADEDDPPPAPTRRG